MTATASTWLRSLCAFLATRLGVWLTGAVAWWSLPHGRFSGEADGVWAAFQRWDAGWYAAIVEHGYSYVPGQASSVAFFPLYPLVVWLPAQLLGPAAGGTLVSLACLFTAVLVMKKWIQSLGAPWGGKARADTAGWLLLLCPVTVFHGAVYSESLYLALTAGVLLQAERGRWAVAGLLATAATLTRSTGLILGVFLVLRWWEERNRSRGRAPWSGLAWSAAGPLAGLGLYAGYLAWRFGEPFAFSETQAAWKRGLTWPWKTLLPEHLKIYPPFYLIWFLAFLGLAVGLVVIGLRRRLPWSYAAYVTAGVLLFLSSGRLESLPRYLSVLLPLYLIGARLLEEHPSCRQPVFVVSGLLAALSTALFVNGFWFT